MVLKTYCRVSSLRCTAAIYQNLARDEVQSNFHLPPHTVLTSISMIPYDAFDGDQAKHITDKNIIYHQIHLSTRVWMLIVID